jgi:hypothetical protein
MHGCKKGNHEVKTLVLTHVAQCVDMRLAGKWHVTSALLFIVHMITIFFGGLWECFCEKPRRTLEKTTSQVSISGCVTSCVPKLTRTKKQIGILESAFEISYA